MPESKLQTRPCRLARLAACAGVMLALALGGCTTLPGEQRAAAAAALLDDTVFTSPARPPDAREVFRLSAPMRLFADEEVNATRWRRDARYTLMDSLAAQGRLRLDYDDGYTRTAADAFESRAGNCLSLVIMTAAFAKYLGMPLRYQTVQVRDQYSRHDGLLLSSGHINVVLSRLPVSVLREHVLTDELTVDFIPPNELRGLSVRTIGERTVLAMYMNNRAVEILAAAGADAAYPWAREALRHDPDFLPGINTLAVVYLRAGHLARAEAALRHVLARVPDDDAALSNLVVTLQRAGRGIEAAAAAEQLARVQPVPPFQYLDLGREALEKGEFDRARELIARELRLQPYQHEAHFWAAVVDATLGDSKGAEKHLRKAIEHSATPQQQARYNAKLEALKEAAVTR